LAKQGIAAIDIGTHAVQVAVVSKDRGGYRVDSAATALIASDDADGRAAAVKQALADAGARSAQCVVSLPRSMTVTRLLEGLPTGLDKASMRDIVALQAESDLPFEPGAAAYDFHNMVETDSGVSVELVAARTADVEALLAPAREAGGKPIGVTPGVIGLGVMATAQGLGVAPGSGALVLDVGHSNTDAALVREGVVVFARSFPVGGAALAADAEAACRRFVVEVERTLQAMQREPFAVDAPTAAPFDSVWMCGGASALPVPGPEGAQTSLASVVEDALGVGVRSGFESSTVQDAAGLASAPGGWQQYAIAVGLAIEATDGELSVDVMPRAERQRHEQSDRTRVTLAYAGAAALLFVSVYFLGGRIAAAQERQVRDVNAQIRGLGSDRKLASDRLSDMSAMTAMLERKHSVLDVLRELTELLPARTDIAVTALSIDDSGKVTASFEARSADAMSAATRALGSSVWFRNVDQSQVTSAEKNGQQVQVFSVSLELAEDVDVLAARRVGAAAAAAKRELESGGNEDGQVAEAGGGQRGGRNGGPGSAGVGGGRRDGGGPGGGRDGSRGRSSEGGGRGGSRRSGGSDGGKRTYSTADGGTKVIEGGRVTIYSADGSVLEEYDEGPEVASEEDATTEDEEREGGVFVEKRDAGSGDGDKGDAAADSKDDGDSGDSDADEKRADDDGDSNVRVRRAASDGDGYGR
jgi:Tfp pilus assembly protein PilN